MPPISAKDITELPDVKKHPTFKSFSIFVPSNSSAPKEVETESKETPKTDFFKQKPIFISPPPTAPKSKISAPPDIISLAQSLNKLKTPADKKLSGGLLEYCSALILKIVKTGDETAIRYLAGMLDQPQKYSFKDMLNHSPLNTDVIYSAKFPSPSCMLSVNTFMSAILDRISHEQQQGTLNTLYDLCYLCGLHYKKATEPRLLGELGSLHKSTEPQMVITKGVAMKFQEEYQSGVTQKLSQYEDYDDSDDDTPRYR
ncbi:MAG TPA: hypothetical protein VHE99_12435 [Gammaproteobacteria bacterium]|nr:hypothetical protein [Gammaproteobacteria bacterium]